ncbi:hypothetical protein [Roseiconus nitratireducens]|nr:hypothetical protein [Roseiconus nitratireducens]
MYTIDSWGGNTTIDQPALPPIDRDGVSFVAPRPSAEHDDVPISC